MKNILLAVTGLSPQVITEAIYALAAEGRRVHAIHCITTRTGRERIVAGLLDCGENRLRALFDDCGISSASVDFGAGNIHVLRGVDGAEINDIVSPDDNEALIRTCLDLAFRFTTDPGTAVWFLVAGGRKTMTSCLTLAAHLYGRPQDRLFHVLVSPEFESCRNFWYPPRQPAMLELRDEKGCTFWKKTSDARIHLITIPFVSVRDQLRQDCLDHPLPPADIMQSLIRDLPPVLTVHLNEGKIVYGRQELDLHPTRLALYAFFAESKLACERQQSCSGCFACFIEAAQIDNGRVACLYERTAGARLLAEMSDSGIGGSLTSENFQSYKSKIRKDILSAFGQTALVELEIASSGTRPDTRYGIRLDRSRIRMEGGA